MQPLPPQDFVVAPDPPEVRSAVPKVLGILMIIFGAFASFGGLFGLINRTEAPGLGSAWATMSTLSLVFDVIGLGVGTLQLYTGIKLLGYKDTAPKLALVWGVLNSVTAIAFSALLYFWLKPQLGEMGEVAISFVSLMRAFISVAWSVTVIALVMQPYPRRSCTNY